MVLNSADLLREPVVSSGKENAPLETKNTDNFKTPAQNTLAVQTNVRVHTEAPNLQPKSASTDSSGITTDALDSSESPISPVRAPPRRKKKKNRPILVPPVLTFEENSTHTQAGLKEESRAAAVPTQPEPKKGISEKEPTVRSKSLVKLSDTDETGTPANNQRKSVSYSKSPTPVTKSPREITQKPMRRANPDPVKSKGPYRIPTLKENVEKAYEYFVEANQEIAQPNYAVSHLYYMRQHSIAFDPKSRWKKLRIWQMPRISLVWMICRSVD